MAFQALRALRGHPCFRTVRICMKGHWECFACERIKEMHYTNVFANTEINKHYLGMALFELSRLR